MSPNIGFSRLLVANFKGSAYERGKQHGELFGQHVKESGINSFYGSYCEEMLLGQPIPIKYLIRLFHRLCASRHSSQAQDLIRGFCEASGFNTQEVSRALVMPDVLNYLAGFTAKLSRLPGFGCTSVAVWDGYSADNRFLYGRNLDFPGNGYWDCFPLIARHKPDKGIPYVSISSAGTIVDGITGINEEGLSLALHQHLTSDVGILLGGRPILDLGLEVLQFAKTIEEAIAICSRWRVTSGWSLILTHWKKRECAALELTNSRLIVHRITDGKMVRTNDFWDPQLHRREINYMVFRESTRLRSQRAQDLVKENKGSINASKLASFLCDHWDPERKKTRSIGQTIAQPHNMTSVVFEPEKGIFWVADGEAPVFQGAYRKVFLWEDKVSEEALIGIKDERQSHQRDSYAKYLEAYGLWLETKDNQKIYEKLKEIVGIDQEEPIYRYMFGIFALKVGAMDEALQNLERGSGLPDIIHRSLAQRLWQARALDLLGRRSEAMAIYKEIIGKNPSSVRLKKAAEKGLCRAYKKKALTNITPDFLYGDVYRY